jgi:hypothetical protein
MKKASKQLIVASQEIIVQKIFYKVRELICSDKYHQADILKVGNADIYEKLFDGTETDFLSFMKIRDWSLSRDDLKEFSINRFAKNDFLNPILLSLAWGYGAEDVGPSRAYRFYRDKSNVDLLMEVRDYLKGEKINYGEQLKKISAAFNGVGDIFASKILYTLSFGINNKSNLPIILDRRVVRSLREIIGDEVKVRYCSLDSSGGVSSITKDKYDIFCSEISSVAQLLEINSADVENILFNWRGGK